MAATRKGADDPGLPADPVERRLLDASLDHAHRRAVELLRGTASQNSTAGTGTGAVNASVRTTGLNHSQENIGNAPCKIIIFEAK